MSIRALSGRLQPKIIGKPQGVRAALKPSVLKVFDIPDELLLDHQDNPNEQDDETLDQITQAIKEDGFDEPLIVVPSLAHPGKYLIVSGHHRRKGGKMGGMKAFPSVIKEGWENDKVDMELVRRNVGRGKLNPEKFTSLVNKMTRKGYDVALVRAQMGFTKSDAFNKLYKQVESGIPKAARTKLAEAKERMTSVDGLSSVINEIFTDHGADLDHGFLVFNFGNKTHHYVPTDDKVLDNMLTKLEQRCRDEGLDIRDVFKRLISSLPTDIGGKTPSATKGLVANGEARKRLRPAPRVTH